jgi:hypothetical protein
MPNSKQGSASDSAKKSSSTESGQSWRLDAAEKDELPDSSFAFPKERKEPLMNAEHVRNAIARFDQVEGVTDDERDRAWKRITEAAKKFDVMISESSWHERGKKKS